MAQSNLKPKAPDDSTKRDTKSDEIVRSIIDPMVAHAAGTNARSTTHTKPPLPHHPNDSSPTQNKGNNMNRTSSRNIVFHPDHPEKIYDDDFSSDLSDASPDNDAGARSNGQPEDKDAASGGNKENARSTAPANGSGSKSSKNGASGGPADASTSEVNGSRSNRRSSTREERRERKRKLDDPTCFPKRFEVQVQARVRVGEDLSSAYLTDLPEGSVVTVEEIVDRRARISRPLCGWLSVTSKFGARIILPTNSKYSKIGGKVMFKRPVPGQSVLSNGQHATTAKVIDFNDERNLYKLRYDDGTSQWMDIEHPDITFISQHRAVKVPKSLDGTAPTFTLQTSQAFFNQFFCKDYPSYQAQSSSTTRKMDISPVAGQHPNGQFARYPPHGGANPNGRQYPPSYTRHGQYPQGPGPYPNGQPPYPPGPYPHGQDPRHGPQVNGRPHQGPPMPGMPMANSPYNNQHHAAGPLPTRPPPQPPSDQAAGDKQEFVKKVKEIERRIIQHLHQRGYDESHPDYHRYLAKAKELAIQKAQKEREKQRAAARQNAAAAVVPGPYPGGISAGEYQKMMQYRRHKQEEHEKNERERRLRMQREQAERQEALAQQAKREGRPAPKTSASVKGLIVLRGLPGSGKTTLAKKLSQRSKHAQICTEDRYHWSGKEDGVGEYKFQPQLVFLAREWCTKEIRQAIQENVNLIILDNHNARISMYEDHIQYAVEHGYRFRIIEFVASASLIDKYRARSYKKFPREVYVKLLKLWEHDPRTELINPTFGDPTSGPKATPDQAAAKSATDNGNAQPNQSNDATPNGNVSGNGNGNDEDDESNQTPSKPTLQ